MAQVPYKIIAIAPCLGYTEIQGGGTLKVVHLISGGDVGGAKTHVLTLLRGLTRSCGITLVCFRDGPFADDARAMGIDTRIINGNGIGGDLRALTGLIKNGGYDIVHSHGSRGNTMSALIKPRVKLPTVTTVHSDYKLDYLGSPVRGMTYGTLNRWALTKLGYFTGVSDQMSELLIKRGFPAHRVFTIYNGLNFDRTLDSSGREEFWRVNKLDVKPDDIVAGIAARFDAVKDVGSLIEAFARVAGECPKLKLALAGDGKQHDMLVERVRHYGLESRVFFLGWQNDMDSFYRAIDINTLTSKSETFPYALTEGARASLATVSSRVGGVPRLIDDGVNGLLYTSGDIEPLARHLKTLYGSGELRASFGKRLYEKARAEFSIEKTIETQENIYGAILQNSARPVKKRDGITLCGAYGYSNAGDDGILTAILGHIRDIDPTMPVRVMTRKPRQTACQFRVETMHTLNVFALTRAFSRSELYINGGGNLIQDITSSRSLWFYLFTLWWAKRRGAKTLMFACGVGPIKRGVNRRLAVRVMSRNVDAITIREPDTVRELENMGVKIRDSLLTADPALCIAPAPDSAVDSVMFSAGLEPGGGYMGLALRDWEGFPGKAQSFADMIDAAYEKYGLTAVLIPFESKRDEAVARDVVKLAKSPCAIASGALAPNLLIGLLSRMRLVVGMRLHALIFASGQGVPLIGVSYDNKASSFLSYLGQDMFCPFEQATSERLVGLLDECMSRPDNPQERLAAVERLREMEKGNTEMLKKMLGDSLI